MTYPGGKSGAGVYQRIINLIPPHRVYIEPFVGGGAILRYKRPAAVSIAIDADPAALKLLESSEPAIRACTFINGDGIQFLRDYDWRGDEFVYCDPPYLMETRRGGRLYNVEMTDAQHLDLLSVVVSIPAAVMISGYPSEIYHHQLAGWDIESYKAMTRGGFTGDERLWMNYSRPTLLHDDQYLGKNFRERERIKRKRARWANKFRNLPIHERGAIFRDLAGIVRGSAIAGLSESRASSDSAVSAGIAITDDRVPIAENDDGRPTSESAMLAGADRHD